MNILEQIRDQAIEELPQIEDFQKREDALERYINEMTNIELLELIMRTFS